MECVYLVGFLSVVIKFLYSNNLTYSSVLPLPKVSLNFITVEFSLPPVTVESLKEDKGYSKLAKKYIKEYDGLQKKQNKERTTISGNQCKSMEKLAKSKKFVISILSPLTRTYDLEDCY